MDGARGTARSVYSPAPGAATARRIDHVGLVVRDADAAAATWSTRFGLAVSQDWYSPDRTFRLVYLEAGDTTVQLVQPLGPGPAKEFLDARGEGLHHICFVVDDVASAAAASEPEIDVATAIGGRGTRVCFLKHLIAGVLVELTESPLH